MPALIFNIYLDSLEKFEVFKVTYADIYDLFDEKHIKIRGRYSQLALNYINDLSRDFFSYQEINNKDWIDAFSIMVNNIKSRSAFIYLEDHKLIKNKNYLKKLLNDFDHLKLDYLCYSWFYSSQIYCNNLLPLSPKYNKRLAFFDLNEEKFRLLKENSGNNFYSFSLCSLVSVDNLKKIIKDLNYSKFYNKYLTNISFKFFGYPRNRLVYKFVNYFLKRFNLRLFLYPINHPGNLEFHKLERYPFLKNIIKFAVLREPIFTAVDDDNGYYGSSLIKMGKYPFNLIINKSDIKKIEFTNEVDIEMESFQKYPLQYIPHKYRFYKFPVIEICLISGKAELKNRDQIIKLKYSESLIIYSTHLTEINSLSKCSIKLRIGNY